MLKRRWYIARLLMEGNDVRKVAREAEVSTATVVRISHTLKEEGNLLKKVLDGLGVQKKSTKELNTQRYVFGHE